MVSNGCLAQSRIGREEATTRLVIRQLEKRFGTLPKNTQAAISSAPIDSLEAPSEDLLLDFGGLDDLSVLLKTHLS
ncbi:MAG: DUF4351 domain-containing protein, partial [Cyanobacteria bacterium J06635_11]